MAVVHTRPPSGLLHHSDRGSQYCAHDYQRLLQQFYIQYSMSRKGNCYDNAPMESFWGTLKTEPVHHRRYETRAQAVGKIVEYIEIFYKPSTAAFETRLPGPGHVRTPVSTIGSSLMVMVSTIDDRP